MKNVKTLYLFICLSRNPAGAARIVKDTISVKLRMHVTTSERVEEHERGLEEERRRYPDELPKSTLWAPLLSILLFFAIYSLFFITA
ncbi:MAG: hypothetical protein U9N41_01040 [Euryarchaeota archaeon]|nr:hypothetical protein [Euryarchaeota archaeon]